MQSPLVAISGASSFTALWLLQFLSRDFSTAGLVPKSLADYTGLKALRLKLAAQHSKIFPNIPVENGLMSQWILAHRPRIWIHHHHHMQDFRSATYDTHKAELIGLEPLENLIRSLKECGTRGVIFSGSYFEPGEGGPEAAHLPRTPYSLSKKKVWEKLSQLCQAQELSVAKVVIPNPIGPLENEDRLIPALIRAAKSQTPFRLMAPATCADNISVEALAQCYLHAIQEILDSDNSSEPKIFRPSGWVQSNQTLVEETCSQLIVRRLKLSRPTVDLSTIREGNTYRNPEAETYPSDSELYWDRYAQVLINSNYLAQI